MDTAASFLNDMTDDRHREVRRVVSIYISIVRCELPPKQPGPPHLQQLTKQQLQDKKETREVVLKEWDGCHGEKGGHQRRRGVCTARSPGFQPLRACCAKNTSYCTLLSGSIYFHSAAMPPKNQKSKASGKAAAAPKEVPAPKGGKGKQASGPPVAVAANAPSKKQQKLSKQEERLMRQQETDAMLIIPDEDDCYAPMIEVEEAAPRKAAPVDSFGNTLSKAAQAQSKEDAKIEIMRAEARARRKAKEDLRLHAEQAAAPPSTDSDHVFNKVKDTLDVEEVRQKLAGGAKLTHKESKLLQRAEAQEAEAVSMQQEADEGLSSFSLSVRSERGQGDETTMSAVDVIVNSFTITAPSKPLLIDASLRIVAVIIMLLACYLHYNLLFHVRRESGTV